LTDPYSQASLKTSSSNSLEGESKEERLIELVMPSGWKRCPICDLRTLRWRTWFRHIVIHLYKRRHKRPPPPYPQRHRPLSEVRCPRCESDHIREIPADWPPITGLHCESCGLDWAEWLGRS